ncbi:MAG TPA: hypothetical protein VKZ95_00865 [Sphingobacteriaceae bacterium]|nr:hypothetical protein [Sphingobacteriaceae bacterium]
MKNLNIYSLLLAAFFLFGSADALAQNHKNKNSEKSRKEYYKKQEKNRKAYKKHDQKKYKKHYVKVHKRKGPPAWAPAHGYRAKNHVYFRDYHTFYDPYRDGYVYRRNNKWIFSRNVPTFLVGVNLGSARINLIQDIPVNTRPEQYYSRYSSQYPRDPKIQVNLSLF